MNGEIDVKERTYVCICMNAYISIILELNRSHKPGHKALLAGINFTTYHAILAKWTEIRNIGDPTVNSHFSVQFSYNSQQSQVFNL